MSCLELRKHQLLVILVVVQSYRCNTCGLQHLMIVLWSSWLEFLKICTLRPCQHTMGGTVSGLRQGHSNIASTVWNCLSISLKNKDTWEGHHSLTFTSLQNRKTFFLLWNIKEDICRTLGSKQHWLLMYENWYNSSKYLLQKKQSRELPLVAGCGVHTVKMHKILELTND